MRSWSLAPRPLAWRSPGERCPKPWGRWTQSGRIRSVTCALMRTRPTALRTINSSPSAMRRFSASARLIHSRFSGQSSWSHSLFWLAAWVKKACLPGRSRKEPGGGGTGGTYLGSGSSPCRRIRSFASSIFPEGVRKR